MVKILTGRSVSEPLLIQLREWLEEQWGNIDSFAGNHPGFFVPAPVIAVDDDVSLLGGLAFSSFSNPRSSEIAVWINALLVSPSQRRKGIASQLVASAEREALGNNVQELFVLTQYPSLYQKLGWQQVGLDSERNETILTKALAGPSLQ